MNRTVIFITVLFILMTLPGAVLSNMYSFVLSQPYGRIVVFVFGSLSLSYHSYGIVILYFTNKKFAQQLRSILGPQKTVHSLAITQSLS